MVGPLRRKPRVVVGLALWVLLVLSALNVIWEASVVLPVTGTVHLDKVLLHIPLSALLLYHLVGHARARITLYESSFDYFDGWRRRRHAFDEFAGFRLGRRFELLDGEGVPVLRLPGNFRDADQIESCLAARLPRVPAVAVSSMPKGSGRLSLRVVLVWGVLVAVLVVAYVLFT